MRDLFTKLQQRYNKYRQKPGGRLKETNDEAAISNQEYLVVIGPLIVFLSLLQYLILTAASSIVYTVSKISSRRCAWL